MVHEIAEKEFNCTKCGACCRKAGTFEDFPEPVNEDGSCVHLTDDNRCSIYQTRPQMCRINALWENQLHQHYTLEEWHDINYQACKKLIIEEGLDESLIPKPTNKHGTK